MIDAGSGPQLTGRWRKSSYTNQGNCVEVATTSLGTALRNSNRPEAGTLHLTTAAFASWVEACKAGQFDEC